MRCVLFFKLMHDPTRGSSPSVKSRCRKLDWGNSSAQFVKPRYNRALVSSCKNCVKQACQHKKLFQFLTSTLSKF